MSADRLDAIFNALADPTRRTILVRLRSGEASVTELAEPFQMSLPAVSKHLKVLERAGLISRSREAQWRPARLEIDPFREAADWIQQYVLLRGESYDRLADVLRELHADEKAGPGDE